MFPSTGRASGIDETRGEVDELDEDDQIQSETGEKGLH